MAQVLGWTGNNRVVPWLYAVPHTPKNRVARDIIPGSLLAVGSNKGNKHKFLVVWSGARSTTRADERCTEFVSESVYSGLG